MPEFSISFGVNFLTVKKVWLLDQNLEVFSCSRVAGLKTSSAEVHPLKVMKILYKGCFLKITDPKL